MDNASKALIMAGAILISVAIVGIGIYIFSVANTMTNDAVNSIESTSAQMFNNQFYRYSPNSGEILGTRANELINHANAVNVTVDNKVTGGIKDRSKYVITYGTDSTGSGYINKVTIKAAN